MLAAHPTAFFTIPHFDGYSAVLIELRKVSAKALREAIVDGWLACARHLANTYLHRRRIYQESAMSVICHTRGAGH